MPVLLAEAGTSVSSAVSEVVSLASSAISIITGNPVLMIMFCAGLVGVGFGVVRKAKGASRS